MRPSYQTQAPITSASRTCISTARSSAAPSSSCLPAKISRCLDFRHQGTKPMNTESGSQLIWWDTFLDTMLQDTRAMRKPLSAAACKLAISTATAPCLESWPGWIAVPHASQASSKAGTLTLSMVSEACSTRSNPQACAWQSLRMHHTRSKAKCCGCDASRACNACLSAVCPTQTPDKERIWTLRTRLFTSCSSRSPVCACVRIGITLFLHNPEK